MSMQFTLIQNAQVFTPADIGKNDILICAGKIIAMAPQINVDWDNTIVINAAGKLAVPGIVDQHVHVTGGGGEGSFRSRVPELNLSDCITNGVTTLVGMLGTDSITRSVENLVAKTKALNEEGVTAYCLTGSYEFPSPTVTGSVKNDIAFIKEVIGVKIAIADHRNSAITTEELTRLTADVRLAALVSGKPGLVHLHTGRGKEGLAQLFDILENTNIPIKHFRPTHMQCRPDVFKFASLGGIVDFSSQEDPSKTAAQLIQAMESIAMEQITLSSDSNGSLPMWDSKRENIVGMGVGRMTTLFAGIRALVTEYKVPLSTALRPVTETVAKALEVYPAKGALLEGSDADILLLDKDLQIDTTIAMGKIMMEDKKVLVRGYFEGNTNLS